MRIVCAMIAWLARQGHSSDDSPDLVESLVRSHL
jgi:hypothetical protein